VLQLWDVNATPRLVRSLRGLQSINGQPESVEAVAFAPDGRSIVAGDVNHTPGITPFRYGAVAAWSVATGKLQWLQRNRDGWVCTVVFSPGGNVLAVAQEQGRVRLRDVRSGRVLRTITLYGGPAANAFSTDSAAFARDGTLATGTWAGIVQLWKPSTGVEKGRPTLVAAAPVSSIAFDPAKPLFATAGGSDGIVKLWSSTTLRQFGANFPRVSGQWGNAQFTPDGSKLVVIWKDGHAAVWPTDVASWEAHACRVPDRRLTREEWARFVGSRAYAPAC
jgi:WD40 repeat protein